MMLQSKIYVLRGFPRTHIDTANPKEQHSDTRSIIKKRRFQMAKCQREEREKTSVHPTISRRDLQAHGTLLQIPRPAPPRLLRFEFLSRDPMQRGAAAKGKCVHRLVRRLLQNLTSLWSALACTSPCCHAEEEKSCSFLASVPLRFCLELMRASFQTHAPLYPFAPFFP